MRYKIDTESKKIEIIQAEGKEILELSEQFPDYTFSVGSCYITDPSYWGGNLTTKTTPYTLT